MVAAPLIEDANDILYEEDLLRNSYSLKYWLRYLDAKRRSAPASRNVVYERALKHLPGSYKLWRMYLRDRREQVKAKCRAGRAHDELVNVHERALVYMHKMPRIWLDYLELLCELPRPTHTRHAFDRALRALPLTQHERVWPLYLTFVSRLGVTETAVRVYRRYLKFDPDGAEEYIDFLLSAGRVGEAAARLAELLNRESFSSPRGETRHAMWLRLCALISEHPAECAPKLRGEAIIRGGLREFSNETGHIWTSLADFFIRQAQFERARDVYEEAATSVPTVRDFSMVFDAYAQFEESMIGTQMEGVEALEAQAGAAREAGGEPPPALAARLAEAQADLDIRLARLERLTERRPELLSSVLLRQNPHSVKEWLKRVELFKGEPARAIHTFATAVKSVDPQHATHGRLSAIWLAFAKFYEAHGDVPNARAILRKAADVEFRSVDELAGVWLERAELELRHKQFQAALALLREATTPPPPAERSKRALEAGPARCRLFRVTSLWAMYTDLEESVGTFDSAKRAYERMFELKVITPQLVLNFAAFLEERKYFEQAFQAYERGVATFAFPWALQLWRTYLGKFVARYGGEKLERARDLFEQALEKCPAEHAAPLYRSYAEFELQHGLARRAMAILEKGVDKVAPAERLGLYRLYIERAAEAYGVTRTREIYEKAVDALPDAASRLICLEYATLETKLGEIERARALYTHAAQVYDPQSDERVWQAWNDFEVEQGSEDSFREMLRIKRAVRAQYAAVGGAAAAAAAAQPAAPGAGGPADQMSLLEQQQAGAGGAAEGFLPSPTFVGVRRGHVFKRGPYGLGYYQDALAARHQPLALAAGGGAGADGGAEPADDSAAADGAAADGAAAADAEGAAADDGGAHAAAAAEPDDVEPAIQQRTIPDAVFGSAAGAKRDAEDAAPLGALERFKQQRRQ